jgi:hypothetical protein
MSSDLRFDVRFVVFTRDDIFEGVHRLTKSAVKSRAQPGDYGYASLDVEKAAKWTIREARDATMPRKRAHLDPLMFNLWFLFSSREDLVDTLTGLTRALTYQLERSRLEPGMSDHVPGTGMNGPMGLWELTRVHVEPPTAYRFDETPIWNY